LFGYEKGAFTGALNDGHSGKFELAHGGTIFLDEIGELPIEIQSKLLRILDTHRVMRIGGKAEKLLDIRIIVATNRDLLQEVKTQRFREDLYYRLNIFKFSIPPLRNRPGDITMLVNHFVEQLNEKENHIHPKSISEEFLRALRKHSWPGNVRELQNVVVRAYYCCGTRTVIGRECLADNFLYQQDTERVEESARFDGASKTVSYQSLRQLERQYLVQTIQEQGGNVMAAAKKLGMSKATIYRHIHKYAIDLKTLHIANKVSKEEYQYEY
jgi:transcriptional regulator with PAS, ATPase and Fis domain